MLERPLDFFKKNSHFLMKLSDAVNQRCSIGKVMWNVLEESTWHLFWGLLLITLQLQLASFWKRFCSRVFFCELTKKARGTTSSKLCLFTLYAYIPIHLFILDLFCFSDPGFDASNDKKQQQVGRTVQNNFHSSLSFCVLILLHWAQRSFQIASLHAW